MQWNRRTDPEAKVVPQPDNAEMVLGLARGEREAKRVEKEETGARGARGAALP